MNPAMFPDQVERQMAHSFIPALIMAGMAVASAVAKKKGQGRTAENQALGDYNRQVWQQQQFDPYAPLRTGARGALWSAQMKTWGFDKLFPTEMLEYVGNPANVPGTAGIIPGGRENIDPSQTGMAQPNYGMGGWDWAAAGLAGAQAYGQAQGFGEGGGGEGFETRQF